MTYNEGMFLLNPEAFPWDLAILILLAFCLSGVLACTLWLKCRRKAPLLQKLLVGVLGVLGVLGFLTITYGSFIEPFILLTTTYSVPFPTDKPLKIAVISDLELGPYSGKSNLERVVRQVRTLTPDLIVLLGDFIHMEMVDPKEFLPLQDLSAPLGTFVVFGNHEAGWFFTLFKHQPFKRTDYREGLTPLLKELGVRLLRNTHVIIETEQGNIALAGVDDTLAGDADAHAALQAIPEGMPTILLSHSPDIVLQEESHFSHLIIAGHTHGGQIRLPFIGPLVPLPTKLGRSVDYGLFRVDSDTTLAITKGIGSAVVRARLFAWPEVMLLETKRPES